MTATDIAGTTALSPAQARSRASRRARARMWDRIATGTLWGVGAFIGLVFLFIIIYTVQKGFPSIISPGFFTSGIQSIGIAAEIFNTFYILVLSMIFMVPIGIGAAIYIVEYGRQERFLRVLRFATETLTSSPTLIVGLLGFLLFASSVKFFSIGPITIHGFGFSYSRLAGALTLALINIPWMLRTSEDALRAVPRDYRAASQAVGATRWQTTIRVVLPAAIPGLITSLLIVAGRVTGETAALILTAGQQNDTKNVFDFSPFHAGETLATHAYLLFNEPGANSVSLRLGTALTLIVLVLAFNIIARLFGEFFNRRFRGR